jgi:predicted molibdopterin-dependent oxidoreductase YjgC
MTNPFDDLEHAECIFIIGSNTTVAHPLVAMRLFEAKARGSTLIVVDPRKTHIAREAAIHLQHQLGTDVALLNGLMHVIHKNGWHHRAFIEERTEGVEALLKVIEDYPPERVSRITGVDAGDLERVAEIYAKARTSSIVYCLGITQHWTAVDNVKSLANLAMLCGQIGRPSTGVNPLRGQNNVQGACDMGGLPNVYPGYQVVTDAAIQGKFEAAWGRPLSPRVGLTIMEMMEGCREGRIKAMVILGENPVVSDPDSTHVKRALESTEFFMAIDIFPTPTTALAHLVLPAASFAEVDGTFTNSERRVQLVRKAIDPVAGKANWEILQELSTRLGYPEHYQSAAEIYAEMASLSPPFGGIRHERLENGGLCWPCPTPDHPGTPILHVGQFTRGRGVFHGIEFKPPAEVPDAEFPYWMTTGMESAHYLTGTMTRRCAHLHREMPELITDLNPEDAGRLNVEDGGWVRVTSRRGSLVSRVAVSDCVQPGMIFMPLHFEEAPANLLTNTAMDPISKTPEYKVCAVRVEKVGPEESLSR